MGKDGPDLAGGFENLTGIDIGGVSNADRALDGQNRAAQGATELQKYMYDQTRTDQQPWRDAGVKAIGGMQDPNFQKDFSMEDYQADPGFAFRLQQGQKALEGSASARGSLHSGATLKALTRYGQEQGSNEYQNAYNRFNTNQGNRFNRLASLAGAGQTANAAVGQAGQQYANQAGENMMGAANANAAAAQAQQGSMTNLIGVGLGAGLSKGGFFSDARLKTDIQPISKADIQELRKTIKPYLYNFRDETYGEGEWIGVMAQDLEKSKLGRTIVTTGDDGLKRVDLKKAVSLALAVLTEE